MRIHRLIIGVVIAASMAAWAQPAYDSETVLEHTRERLLDDLSRLPRYTCVQTITRRYFYAPPGRQRSCPDLVAAHDQRPGELKVGAWDRLRLEVAIVEGHNAYSWVGASQFGDNNFEELAGRGPLGSGDFGSFLDSIFRYGIIHFERENMVQGRPLLEYAYEMPLVRSGYLVRAGPTWVPTAYSGAFLLDPAAADVVQVTVRTTELPENNPSCRASSEIDYQRTPIHDRLILIPRETRLHAIDRDGAESLNVTTYEHCREYASQSRVLASAPAETAANGTPPQPPALRPLSPGLRFECRITTAIDSETAAAGDPVEGVLRSPIHDKKNKFTIPTGSQVHGRITQMEHHSGPIEYFRVSVQWESISAEGREIPIRAQPEPFNQIGRILVPGGNQSPDGRSFVFRADHLHLQQLDWNWITLADGKHDRKGQPAAAAELWPHTVEIVDGEFSIDAASGIDFKLTIPAGATNVRLEGTFNTRGGSPDDVDVLLFTSDEFIRWRNREPATAFYKSGENPKGVLDVSLSSAAGPYYLVFSNYFPLSTPKVVEISARLHYTLGSRSAN